MTRGRGGADPRPAWPYRRGSRPRADRGVVVALFLLLLSPLVWLLLFLPLSLYLETTGLDPATAQGASRLRSLEVAYVVLGVLPLAVAAVLGARARLRRGRVSGLLVAVGAVLAAAAFVAFPLLAGR